VRSLTPSSPATWAGVSRRGSAVRSSAEDAGSMCPMSAISPGSLGSLPTSTDSRLWSSFSLHEAWFSHPVALAEGSGETQRIARRLRDLDDRREDSDRRGDLGWAEWYERQREDLLRTLEQAAAETHALRQARTRDTVRKAGLAIDESWIAQSPLLPSVCLPINLDGEVGWVEEPRVTRPMLGGWLYWYPLYELDGRQKKVIELVESALSASAAANDVASRDSRLHAKARSRARADAAHTQKVLRAAIRGGLVQREGTSLSGSEEIVFVTLASRLFAGSDASASLADVAGGFSVCECCAYVWPAKRARRCRACRRRSTKLGYDASTRLIANAAPAPGQVAALIQRDGERGRLAVRAAGPGLARNVYAQTCHDCGVEFLAEHAATLYCEACETPAAHTRRSRERRGLEAEAEGR
jgi:hypothetical protein